jgi:hypothetical protein
VTRPAFVLPFVLAFVLPFVLPFAPCVPPNGIDRRPGAGWRLEAAADISTPAESIS